MEAVSASSSRTEHPGIETIPSEILDKIFSFACENDCDISLGLTSRSMMSKLESHAIIRTLEALMDTKQIKIIFQGLLEHSKQALVRLLFQPATSAACQAQALERIANTQWCTTAFVGRLQIALIKRVLTTYWDRLLARDRCCPSAISHEYMFLELEEFARNPTALRDEWLIESKVDAVRGRYPWTRVYVWPKQGRVMIRDQLLNSSVQYCVPLLEKFFHVKKGMSRT